MCDDELILVERVFLRFVSCDDDESLQHNVTKLLGPCLLTLGSPKEGVRKKVLELFVHLNKRIKSNSNIKLPMGTLVELYANPKHAGFTWNFTIVYIKMGFPRCSSEEKASVVGPLLQSLEGKPPSQQDSLLFMILPYLGEMKPDSFKLAQKPLIKSVLIKYISDYLLLPYGVYPDVNTPPPPCLNYHAWKRVSGDPPYPGSDVITTNKGGICVFLGSGVLKPSEAALPLILALADTRYAVVSKAESAMRQIRGSLDWNNSTLIEKIRDLFLGNRSSVNKDGNVPADVRLRLKFMPYLIKSREATIRSDIAMPILSELLNESNDKLKIQAVTFMHKMIDDCTEDDLTKRGSVLFEALTDIVTAKKSQETASSTKIRHVCFLALGKLGAKVPSLVNESLTMVRSLFHLLPYEDNEMQMSIKECLSIMSGSFKLMDANNLTMMDTLLCTNMDNKEKQVRLISVQYAGEIFEPSHVSSRYTLLLGAGDVDEEVSRCAKRYLYGELNDTDKKDVATSKTKILPPFEAMANFILKKSNVRSSSKSRICINGVSLPFNPVVYSEILDYLRICLMNTAVPEMVPQKDWLKQPTFEAPIISKYLINLYNENKELVMNILKFAERLLEAQNGPQQSTGVLQIIGCTSSKTYQHFEKKISWLKSLLSETQLDVRDNIAHLIGVVLSNFEDNFFDKSVADLISSFGSKSTEYQHGIISALGYSFGNKMLTFTDMERKRGNNWEIYHSTVVQFLIEPLTKDDICKDTSHSKMLILNGICFSIGEIGRSGSLPLDDDKKLEVSNRLVSLVKSEKMPMKLREKAGISAGQLCVGDWEFPHRQAVIDGLISSALNVEDIELHLSIGEALVYASLGPLSTVGSNLWTGKSCTHSLRDESYLSKLLDVLIKVHTRSTHPKMKQASCLWLLSLVKSSLEYDSVKERLLAIQSSFMGLLGEGNDLVQDAAAKGLGLVYESCTEEQKSSMVNQLIGTLLEDKATSVKQVSEDTKVFEKGEMGQAPSGGNISTYKELCSLATDLNQPDLVYKFMHLANYNLAWESRKGAAFGFGSIAARAGKQLEPLIPKIVPKLYRYQFDPSPKIQQSMSMIWNSIVPEPRQTVDGCFTSILEELLRNLTSNQWRVRESCCGALQELLRGRTFSDDDLQYIPSLWKDLFRVMDDIKETVRGAATKAAAALSNMCIKMVEMGVHSAEKTVKVILPALLEKGILSSVSEVKSISLNTIMKISKNAGISLKPHLSTLIPALLEACSELEGKDINYMSTRLANDASVQEKLDAARISAAKTSPMMECVNDVIQYIDKDSLVPLIPGLVELIKSSVGLNTKGVTAHFVISLTTHCPLDMQSFTGKLLSAFVAGLSDRNRTVRKIYAGAIGHLMKTAKESSVEKLVNKLSNWYITDTSRFSVVYTFQAINQYNQDVINSHAAKFMPIVFMAMHESVTSEDEDFETKKEIIQIWKDIWNEGTPTTESGINLYLNEIIDLLSSSMEAQQWKVKSQAAKAMGTIASKLGLKLPPEDRRKLCSLLLKGLAGRTWSGKETIVEALSYVCSSPDGILNHNDASSEVSEEKLVEAIFKECKKEGNIPYRIVSIRSAGVILDKLEIDHFDKLYEIVFPFIKVEKKEEDSNVANEENASKKRRVKYENVPEELEEDKIKLELQRTIFEALGRAWPKNSPGTQKQHIVELLELVFNHIESTTIKNLTCLVKTTGDVMRKWRVADFSLMEQEQKDSLLFVAQILSVTLVIPRAIGLKSESLTTLEIVAPYLNICHEDAVSAFKEEIALSLNDVVKDLAIDASLKSRARNLKQTIFT